MFNRSRCSLRVLLVVGACLLFASSSRGGETFKDDARGYSLTLPDGFVANATLASASPTVLHAFTLNVPSGSKPGIILFIEKMDGTIDQEHLTPESIPAGFKGRLFTTNWQGFVVDAIEVPEKVGNVTTTTYNVQIPLRRAAIQIKLFGPAERRADLDRLLTEILNGLHGESNWTAVAPNGAIPAPNNDGTVLLVVAIAFVVAGLVGLYFLSQRTPKGTVLCNRRGNLHCFMAA